MWPFSKATAPRRAKRTYMAAAQNRLTADWITSPASADTDIIPHLRLMRARSRDLSQNNDYAKRFLWLLKSNVIGYAGIMLQNKAHDEDGTMDTAANEMIEGAFHDWGRHGACTMCGGYSWISFQQAVIESVARDGECLIQKVRTGRYGFALHILEADMLDEDLNDPARRIRGGVECDEWGRPIRYHLLTHHPGDTFGQGYIPTRKYNVVQAADMIHLFLKERPGQTRGVPWMVTPAYRLKQLGGMEEAELIASRLAASKMGFFTTEDGGVYVGDDEEDGGALITEAEPGTFEKLPAGMKFESWNPNHPNASFEAFCKSLLRGISSGLNVSYVALANNLEGVSYSSIRQGELCDRDMWRLLQKWFVETCVDRIYAAWLPMAIMSGAINLPARKFDKFNQPHWMPRGWNWVDPAKEMKASIDAVRNGFKSLSDVISEQGRDIEDVFEQLAYEKALAQKYGLELPALGLAPEAPEPQRIEKNEDE